MRFLHHFATIRLVIHRHIIVNTYNKTRIVLPNPLQRIKVHDHSNSASANILNDNNNNIPTHCNHFTAHKPPKLNENNTKKYRHTQKKLTNHCHISLTMKHMSIQKNEQQTIIALQNHNLDANNSQTKTLYAHAIGSKTTSFSDTEFQTAPCNRKKYNFTAQNGYYLELIIQYLNK